MKSPLVIIGTILIIAAFVVMGLFIVGPAIAPSLDDVPLMKSVLQSVLCKGSEKLTADYSTYSTRPGNTTRSVEMGCVNNENQAREVSGQAILYGVVGYLIPFLLGLFMVISGAGGSRRRVVLTTNSAFGQFGDMLNQGGMSINNAGFQVTVDPSGKVEVKTPDGQVYTPSASFSGMTSSASSTTERLQQLKTMHDSGLITEAEYEAKKQEILKQL
jgi:hypothetical protein